MKNLTTETKVTGQHPANVHDHQSGQRIGGAIADWDAYRLWAEGPSDVCEARRVLQPEAIVGLGIRPEDVIFLTE